MRTPRRQSSTDEGESFDQPFQLIVQLLSISETNNMRDCLQTATDMLHVIRYSHTFHASGRREEAPQSGQQCQCLAIKIIQTRAGKLSVQPRSYASAAILSQLASASN